MGKKPQNVPDHDPPQGYICYRCGEKGHWIQLCPTNDNPEFDNRPRVKRTTGIPRSFLKTVDKATALAQHGDGDDSKTPSGIMVNADGEFVIAEPDKASWEQFQAKAKSTAKKAPPQGDKEVQELGLECPIDKRMFIDPMKTPCCEKTYCNDCITNALIESDFVCPACQTEGVLIDDLKPDDEAAAKIKNYLAEKEGKSKEGSKSPKSTAAASPKSPAAGTAEVKDEEQTKETKAGSKSPQPTAAAAASIKSPRSETAQTSTPQPPSSTATPVDGESTSKKRPAEEAAENPKIPKAPKAMQQKAQAQNMMDMMAGGMPGMNMPMMPGPFGPGFPPMGGMGMGMGMPNLPMGPMGMMNPMMNPMMTPGFMPPMGPGQFGGMPNFNGPANGPMGMPGMGMNGMGPGMNGMNGMNGGAYNQNQYNMQQQQHGPGYRNFSHQPADDEDAYFRKPVNPHRHQNKTRRVRPSDYREL